VIGRSNDPPRRVGLIDLGTNTATLSVLFADDKDRRRLRVAEDLHIITGLGRARGPDGSLSSDGQRRAFVALRHFAGRLDSMAVAPEAVFGAATSATREAPNGAQFLDEVRAETGLSFTIVDGEEEAELVALAQERSFPRRVPLLVIDIGGGSTELALRQKGQTDWAVSLPVGSVKLGERLGSDVAALDDAVEQALSEAPPVRERPTLVGVAGTVTTTLQLARGLITWDPEEVQGAVLTREEVETTRDRLGAMTPQQRREIPGLHPGRADLIVAGMSLLLGMMRRVDAHEVLVSDRGVRFGLLWQRWPLATVLQ
jgi:exopolyphosphatase / guanosine-5'-triphosphate,3'-diphosphate pyrophosphatase